VQGCDRDVTGLELAEISQQSHVSVMDITVFPLKDLIQDPEVCGMDGLWGADRVRAQQWGSK